MMLWKINGKNTVALSAHEVVEQLVGAVLQSQKQDHEELALRFVQRLENSQILHTISLTQLVAMAFSLGYYYRLLLANNDVTVEGSDESTDTADSASS